MAEIRDIETFQSDSEHDIVDGKMKHGGGDAPSIVKPTSGVLMETGVADPYVYSMNHKKRGLFIIINNRRFNPKTKMGERTGTDLDAANLLQVFTGLGFKCHMFHDQTCQQMLDIMLEAGGRHDHSESDMFGCAILSHGDEGYVYGTDRIMELKILFDPLKGDKCPSLIGKPKVFFVQACRGSMLDHGVDVADAKTDLPVEPPRRLPIEADCLYAYSTVPGYFSWRNSSKGSWFVQALCSVLKTCGTELDILAMMTRVNQIVAYDFESNASAEYMTKKKQIPSIVSQLTKMLYFPPK